MRERFGFFFHIFIVADPISPPACVCVCAGVISECARKGARPTLWASVRVRDVCVCVCVCVCVSEILKT